MKNGKRGTKRRTYRMRARREAVERTRERILEAAFALWLEQPYDQVTMEGIADRAGVTRQTVVRQFGAKESLARAVVDWHGPREEAMREVPEGDIAAAVRSLVDRYEEMGDANVRMLEMESRLPEMKYALDLGRRMHRSWVERAFAPWLEPLEGKFREQRVTAAYAATDVMVWKLLRRDFGESRETVEQTMEMLIRGVLETPSR